MICRRLIPRLLLCLALGLATTVAVAWISAAANTGRATGVVGTLDEDSMRDGYSCYHDHGRTFERLSWGADLRGPDSGMFWEWRQRALIAGATKALQQYRSAHRFPPSWGHVPSLTPYTIPFPATLQLVGSTQDARGWPFLCLWCEWNAGPLIAPVPVEGGLELAPAKSWRDVATVRALPYRPIWRGLLADTFLFALAWLTLLSAPRAIRTHLRLRRGLCPACAYNLSGLPPQSPCPECGTVPRVSRSSAIPVPNHP